MQYRPSTHLRAIDGLKGIAILAVVLYHYAPQMLPAGLFGVEIFFTLAGFFLVHSFCSGLAKHSEQLDQSIAESNAQGSRVYTTRSAVTCAWNILVRRVIRLWPALVLVTLVSVSLGAVVSPDTIVQLPVFLIGSLTFSINWVSVARGVTYFDTVSPQMLDHLWFVSLLLQLTVLSLALLVVLLLLVKTHHRWYTVTAAVFGFLALLSAIAMPLLVWFGFDVTRVYYGTDTHAFGFMFGVAVGALYEGRRRDCQTAHFVVHDWMKSALAWVSALALVLIAFIMRTGSQKFVYRGGLQLTAVLTILVLASVYASDSWMPTLLQWRPFTLLGKYSYGIYLWHWPLWLALISLLPSWRFGERLWVLRLVAFVLTGLATAFMWALLESPIRDAINNTSAVHTVNSSEAIPAQDEAQTYKHHENVTTVLSYKRASAYAMRACAALIVLSLLVWATFHAVAISPAQSSIQIQLAKNANQLEQESMVRKQQADERKAAEEAARKEQELKERRQRELDKLMGAMDGSQISVIGDSVTLASAKALEEAMPNIVVDAKVSRSIAAADGVIAQFKEQGVLRKFVVISLSTNSAPTIDDYNRIAQSVGSDHILVLVTAFGERAWIPPANDIAAQYVQTHPTNSVLARWDNAISGHTDLLAADGIHPDSEGGAIYAHTVKEAIAEYIVNTTVK